MTRPRLSVHLMARDAAPTVGRALRSLRASLGAELDGQVEVCLVDTGSADGTPDVTQRAAADCGLGFAGVAFSPTTRPDLYFEDNLGAWRGRFQTRYTGEPLLRDWSAARNQGLDLCRGEYVLKLDADDEVVAAEGASLAGIDYLDQHPEVDFLAYPYRVMRPTGELDYATSYTRIWRNRPEVRFKEVCHECVDYLRLPDGSNWKVVDDGVAFVDRRDLPRVPDRNFKVLLREHERVEGEGGTSSPHLLAHLADEAVGPNPRLALLLAERVLSLPGICDSDVAWMNHVKARCYEAMGAAVVAVTCYARAAELGSQRSEVVGLALRLKVAGPKGDPVAREKLKIMLSEPRRPYPRGPSEGEALAARLALQLDEQQVRS